MKFIVIVNEGDFESYIEASSYDEAYKKFRMEYVDIFEVQEGGLND